MKTSLLKSIIESELYVGASEMTQRFQQLRKYGLLPNDKGQAARDLTEDEIVSGVLSVMDNRPGFAGLIVKCSKSLKPVRGTSYSYHGAKSFGEALKLVIQHPDDVIEIRIKGIENDDRGVPPYAYGGRAQIAYKIDGEEKVAYFDPRESLFKESSKDAADYDPRKFKAPFEREYVIKADVFRRIHNTLEQEKQYSQIMKLRA